MKNYLPQKDKYNSTFADVMVSKYRNSKYGITACYDEGDFDLATMRKELIDWQECGDFEALCEVRINYKAWLPVHMYNDDEYGHLSNGDSCGAGPSTCNSASLQYNNGNVPENIIDVNAGGCITRIVVNPSININNNTGARSFQITSAQAVWYFIHNLGFNPNVLTTDSNGQEITGTVTYIDVNTIQITFSQAVTGWAYLS